MFTFILICYILTAYGACNVIVFGDGPFYIFTRLRDFTYNISPHLGKLFSCMMCLPANYGWICSLVDWFLVPVTFTPFNIIFYDCENLWWLAALCDGAFTSGAVYIIYIINEYLEKRIEYYDNKIIRDETNTTGYDLAENDTNILEVEDITKTNK